MFKMTPKFKDTIKVELKITKRSKQIVSEYSKYTKYTEDEIIDTLIDEILKDGEFVNWLNKKRFKKKSDNLIFNSMPDDIHDGFIEVSSDDTPDSFKGVSRDNLNE